MNKEELYEFIPDRSRKRAGKTVHAAELHFLLGYPVTHAAEKAGVSQVTANTLIQRIAKKMVEAGYERTEIRKIVWTLGCPG